MTLLDEIKNYASTIQAEITEKKGILGLSLIIAERKAFLTKKKLQYIAHLRIDDEVKEIKYTEMLKESGSGFSTGEGLDDGMTTGFGFKKEVYKTGTGGREGTIEEQSYLFGKDYSYKFDLKGIRKKIEELAASAGYEFKYQITSIGL